jgi:hypothetical protein
LIDEMVVQRRQIGSSQDTGSRMYATLAGRPDYPVETVTPVAHRVDFRRPSLLRYAVFRWLERLLPDRLAYIPRRRRAFTERGFAAAGLPDLYAVGWEEYMWNLRPFGFHLRMHGAAQSGRPPHACEGVADVSAIAREIAVKLIGDV